MQLIVTLFVLHSYGAQQDFAKLNWPKNILIATSYQIYRGWVVSDLKVTLQKVSGFMRWSKTGFQYDICLVLSTNFHLFVLRRWYALSTSIYFCLYYKIFDSLEITYRSSPVCCKSLLYPQNIAGLGRLPTMDWLAAISTRN